jgi:hypothetical protein
VVFTGSTEMDYITDSLKDFAKISEQNLDAIKNEYKFTAETMFVQTLNITPTSSMSLFSLKTLHP